MFKGYEISRNYKSASTKVKWIPKGFRKYFEGAKTLACLIHEVGQELTLFDENFEGFHDGDYEEYRLLGYGASVGLLGPGISRLPRMGSEHTIPGFERGKTVHALECAAIVIGGNNLYQNKLDSKLLILFNFVGKLLGPKGNSLKRLQEDTMTKMAILGRGSMRDKHKLAHKSPPLVSILSQINQIYTIPSRLVHYNSVICEYFLPSLRVACDQSVVPLSRFLTSAFQEEELRCSGDPKFSHLSDDLHVEITAFAPPAEAHARIAYALAEVRRFLVPDYNDEIRQEQMWEIQILNTQRTNKGELPAGDSTASSSSTGSMSPCTPPLPLAAESPPPPPAAHGLVLAPQHPALRGLEPRTFMAAAAAVTSVGKN
ncbi:hypothetical protein B7P43_G06331 [Cryptotermes secundus]|uniref:KHDC4/BBP-like KH-domain type I domain-containing protein n=1 Tax=Cryptotermes secundus TaxID=105785 RepID=A0A2J7PES3_9NEOP|nr:hypothetical protein B7P43_G06331 [Cryptotermes secundus]